jgi:hypothetical protein
MYDRAAAARELDSLKRDIDLVEFVTNQGYTRDAPRSCRSSVVMKRDGHEMIIKRAEGGRWYYWSRNDPADKGTILDFLARRRDGGLADVVRELREYLPGGSSMPPSGERSENVRRWGGGSFDRAAVVRAFGETRLSVSCPYLVNARCLSQQTLASPRFRGTWRVDCFGSAIFPHRDEVGVCGFEKRGPTFKGFASCGRKSLWLSNFLPGDREIVFQEQGIDALSHHELARRPHAAYASIAGQPSQWQWDFIARFLTEHGQLKAVAAFDADAAGDAFAVKLSQLTSRPVIRERPRWNLGRPEPPGKNLDWNFLLQESVRDLEQGRAAGRRS